MCLLRVPALLVYCLSVLLVALVNHPASGGQVWPEFRGPGGDGKVLD